MGMNLASFFEGKMIELQWLCPGPRLGPGHFYEKLLIILKWHLDLDGLCENVL